MLYELTLLHFYLFSFDRMWNGVFREVRVIQLNADEGFLFWVGKGGQRKVVNLSHIKKIEAASSDGENVNLLTHSSNCAISRATVVLTTITVHAMSLHHRLYHLRRRL